VARGRADLRNDKATNITIELVGESLTHLIGTFIGPEDTPYHGGTYEVVSAEACRDLEHQDEGIKVIPLETSCDVLYLTHRHPSTPGLSPSKGICGVPEG
jgi:hypothetical protein